MTQKEKKLENMSVKSSEVPINRQQKIVEKVKCLNPDCQKIISKSNPRIYAIRGCVSCVALIEKRNKRGLNKNYWRRLRKKKQLRKSLKNKRS